MKNVEVLSGQLVGNFLEFDVVKERFFTGVLTLSIYPFREISKVSLVSEDEKFVVVDVSFNEKIDARLKLSCAQYKLFIQCLKGYKTGPRGLDLPIREVSSVVWIWSAVFILIIVIGLSGSDPAPNTTPAPAVLSGVTKVDVCKAAIQYLSTMRGDQNEAVDKGSMVRINQIRASDGKRFYYDCKIQGSNIIWRMNQADGVMGRWRDTAYDPEVTFTVSNGRILIKENY
ncbi:hypothetical protein MAH1_15850 [Sessilibacter sp. MAH1]